jgi:hypothetical protein
MSIPGTVENLVLDFLVALISNVGLDEAIRLVIAAVGPSNAARVRAILAAEYAANDAAVDVLEAKKLQGP